MAQSTNGGRRPHIILNTASNSMSVGAFPRTARTDDNIRGNTYYGYFSKGINHLRRDLNDVESIRDSKETEYFVEPFDAPNAEEATRILDRKIGVYLALKED